MGRVLPIHLIRALFGGLISFETANYLRVFQFQIVYTWLGLILTVLVVWAAMEYLHHKTERRLHALAWALVALAVFVDFAGEMFGWYAKLPYYDKAAHAFGGAAAVGAVLLYYRAKLTRSLGYARDDKVGARDDKMAGRESLRALAFTQTAGLIYELEEFAEDALTFSARWGGWHDSAGDVLANALGALAIIFIIQSRRFFRGDQGKDGHDTPTTQLDRT